jgi:predicted nuclease with TOPRIM domain
MNNMTLSVSNVTDLASIRQQLQEARREAEEYKKMYSRKEREAEEYKQRLQNMTQAK